MSNLPATTVDDDDLTGLEDFDVTDFVVPRLKIDGAKAVFVDNTSGVEYPDLEVVALGLVKQRILWATDIDDADAPLCKSLDFKRGMPHDTNFPWQASGFNKGDTADDGTLACDACPLKEWGSHPNQDTPWCSEQHTFPVLVRDGEDLSPAILTVQRSAIKPSRAYLSYFVKSRTPLFTVFTKIELEPRKRGSVNYAVPKFKRGDGTDEADWPSYRSSFRQMRDFLQTRRDVDVSVEDDDDDDDEPAAVQQQSTPPSKGSAKPQPVPDDDDDDDLPF